MTPQNQDDLRQNFVFQTLPTKTFRMHYIEETVSGMVDGREALEQAIYLILNTERYQWLIHSWNYGVELVSLIGKDKAYCIPEIERRITEALIQDDRITAVNGFEFTSPSKNAVLVQFNVSTIYGTIEVEKEVEI